MTTANEQTSFRLLRRIEVEHLTGLSTSAIYTGIKAGTFPRPLPIGRNAVAWFSCEIETWIAHRIENREQPAARGNFPAIAHVHHIATGNRLIRRPEVERKTGKSRSAIYADIKAGAFPKPIALNKKTVAWLEREIDEWVIGRLALRGRTISEVNLQANSHE